MLFMIEEYIRVYVSQEYDIMVGHALLDDIGSHIANLGGVEQVVLVSDNNVYALYAARAEASIRKQGMQAYSFVFPQGEGSKSLYTFERAMEFMSSHGFTRSDCVVALGGGVTGDLAGFSAAVYMRGLRFVQIPTTLLATVDSAIGGKTGLNLNTSKNLIGAFHQPNLVICDLDVLDTLPEGEFRNGVSEIIKFAVICSDTLFRAVEAGAIHSNLTQVITDCIDLKRKIVEEDEFGHTGERQILNFGHTVGHAIELCSYFRIPHGEAVAKGMIVMSKMAELLGIQEEPVYGRLRKVIQREGLSTDIPFSARSLSATVMSDKKRSGENIDLILPVKIGDCIIRRVKIKEYALLLEQTLALLQEEA